MKFALLVQIQPPEEIEMNPYATVLRVEVELFNYQGRIYA